MSFIPALSQLGSHPILCGLTLDQVITFIRLTSSLKRDILQPQPLHQSDENHAPDILPPSVAEFLSRAVGIPSDCIADSWDILKHHVWSASPTSRRREDYDLFEEHGRALGLNCPWTTPLKKEQQRQVVVYTLDDGVQPAWSIHLTCPKKPQYMQVGEHHFVEEKVVKLWTSQMLLGWFSASNAARLYEMALTVQQHPTRGDWQFGGELTTKHVWDAFIISALLDDHQSQNTILQVPHTGDQKDRFNTAMVDRNNKFILTGQPDVGMDSAWAVLAVGFFGVLIRWKTTAIDSAGSTSITIPYVLSMGARCLLWRMHPAEAIPTSAEPGRVDVEEEVEWFEIDGDAVRILNAEDPGSVGVVDDLAVEEPCPSKSPTGNTKLKAHFGRQRTHNEQTLVRPCGVIFARATMYEAEAVSNFLVDQIVFVLVTI
ncbi:hypothetical protein FPV67DRAFT_1453519 [Lyophyllum atratum]|nr:hypothetical protein FPV67DRAFT_1453519 [Lyophyllum atratum]